MEDLIKPHKIDRVYIFNSNLISKYEISPKKITSPETRLTSNYLEVTDLIGGDVSYLNNGLKIKSKHTTFIFHILKLN